MMLDLLNAASLFIADNLAFVALGLAAVWLLCSLAFGGRRDGWRGW